MSPSILRIARFVVAASLVIMVGCSSDNEPGHDFRDALDVALDQIVIDNELVGISATAILPNGKIWKGVSGMSYEESEITETHLFGAASITKTFIATLILQLVEEGILDFDDTIGGLLGIDLNNVAGTIKVRQLLSHTSGIYNYNEHPSIINAVLSDPLRIWAPQDIFEFVDEPDFIPGEGWNYSNTNFIILGMMIERITGNTIGQELKSRIIQPLKLKNTLFPVEDDLGTHVANPWSNLITGTLINTISIPTKGLYSAAWSAGALFSTSYDLALFTEALFKGDLLTATSLDHMTTFIDNGNTGSSHFQGYGLGLMQFQGPVEYWGHNGLILGYGSLLAYVPQNDIIIVFLVNREIPGKYDGIMEALLDAVLLEVAVQ